MNKKILYNVIVGFIIVLIIIFCLCIIIHHNKKTRYIKGIECFNNRDWECAVLNFENLNYHDSKEKYYISNAEKFLELKYDKTALKYFKEALDFIPNNKEIKTKIESLEFVVNEQQKKEEIERKQKEEENRINAIKAKISDTAIFPIPTKFGEGYDETIKRYGVTTINRINRLAPKAAELVAQNPNCTRVMAVDVADDKSTRNSITFYADCGDIDHIRDIQRFYVNEKEINTNVIPKSVREQAESINNGQYLLMCEAEIKARLNLPSTYKSSIISSSVYKAPMNTVVTIPFKAKNAFNLEIKHKGTCYYNGATLTDIDIHEEQ